VTIWEVSSGQQVLTIPTPDHGIIRSVAFNPDGQRLITGGSNATAKVWDTRTGQNLLTLSAHATNVTARFSPDGGRIATAGEDSTAKVWDAATGQELFTPRGHGNEVMSVAFSHDGRRLATASHDQTVKIWDALSGQELLTLRGHIGQVFDVKFSPDDQWLATAGYGDYTVRVWEGTRLTPERRLQREAGALVNRLARELPLQDEIVAHLRNDRTLGEPLRQQALVLAERHREDPWQLNAVAIGSVNRPGQDPDAYRRAQCLAEAALRLAPPEYHFYNTDRPRTVLGIAQYRLGRYREALESLQRAQAEHTALAKSSPSLLSFPSGELPPWNYAVMAMAHFQLGEQDQARALLGRLREVMNDPYWIKNSSAQVYLREAEALIEGKPAEPKQ
jgi:hypothetical protein